MIPTLRPLVAGIAGLCFGCMLFAFDALVETSGLQSPWLLWLLEIGEFILTGPGIGVLCYLLAERLQRTRTTAQANIEAERERNLLVLGRLAAAVAHEVRNPLHNLRLAVDELRSELPVLRGHPLGGHVDDAIARIDHAVDLVYQLARPVGSEATAIELGRLVRDACAALAMRRGRPVNADLSLLAAPHTVLTTSAAAFIMVDNLLRNAVEAAGEAPISLASVRREGQLVLRIANPGRLPDGTCDAAGRPLAMTSTKSGGLGLGLSIVAQLAEAAGGTLLLSSAVDRVVVELGLPAWTGEGS
jgi:two-component system sensor histidine kinase HydH